MALRAGGAAGRLLLLLLLSLLLPSLAAGAVNGSSAEAAEPLGGLAEPDLCLDGKWQLLHSDLMTSCCGYTQLVTSKLNYSNAYFQGRGLNATVSTEAEFGVCTVTCGIGIREVLLTSGCPGTEAKCIVRVEECRGPVDCGWGIPISEGLACVKMPCIYIPPENRFKYVWKMLIPSETTHILPNDSAVMEVCRGTHSVTFQCDTQENGIIIASVKYTVYATTEMQAKKSRRIETGQSRRTTDAILVFCLVTGTIVTVGVIFAMIFMILHWAFIKSIWKSKSGQDNQEKLAHKRSLCNME